MESNLVRNHTRDKQNWATARIGQHEVLLPTNHNRCNFRIKTKTFKTSISDRDFVLSKKIPPFWKFPVFFSGWVVVAMVIVINAVIGGFSWVDLLWLAVSTVQLRVFDYSQLSNYTVTTVQNEWWKIEQLMHQSHLRQS